MFILLVDDNLFYVSVMKEMLSKAGFNHIGNVESGLECILQIYKGDVPDVIIIDENQCNANGVDVLKNIRSSNPEVTIIILTNEETAVSYHLLPQKGATLNISKSSITSENLPQLLYTIFTERINYSKQTTVPPMFSLFRKSVAGILNF